MVTKPKESAFKELPYLALPDLMARGKYLGQYTGIPTMHTYQFNFRPKEISRRGLMDGLANLIIEVNEEKLGFKPAEPHAILTKGILVLVDKIGPRFIGNVITSSNGQYFDASLQYLDVPKEDKAFMEDKLLQLQRRS